MNVQPHWELPQIFPIPLTLDSVVVVMMSMLMVVGAILITRDVGLAVVSIEKGADADAMAVGVLTGDMLADVKMR